MRGIKNLCRGWVVLFALAAGVAAFGQTPSESWQRIGLLAGNITAVAVSPNYDADQTVYAGVAGAGLWRSTNRGQTWTQLASVPRWETVTAIATYATYGLGSGKPVYVGTFDGWVYASFDDFATVPPGYARRFTTGNSIPVWISSLASPGAGSFNDFLFVATLGAGIYYNYSYGSAAVYQQSSSGSQTMAYALAVSPTGRLFGCITYGDGGPVFECTGLTTWSPFGPGTLVNVVGYGLSARHNSSGELNLFLTTENHGMWRWHFSGTYDGWDAMCDGTSGATTTPSPANAVAACPNYGGDREVWEGRGDGLRISNDEGATCAATEIGAAVKAIAFAPGYHLGGFCDAFVATDSGLFLRTCGPPPPNPKPTPPAVSASVLALSQAGMPGTWAGGSLGLLRATRNVSGNPFFLQYNASGSPLGKVPFIKAICIPPVFDANGACGTDAATVFVAEWSKGVFKSTDHGNSWSQMSLNWPVGGPSPIFVNDLAISPLYATGSANETLFAATNVGLYRWDGSATGWVHVATDWNYNFTRVALPPTYNRSLQEAPGSMVFVATDNASPGLGGLYYSMNHGQSITHFPDAMEGGGTLQYTDITSIGASPGYGTVDALIFISRAAGGVYFTASWPTASPIHWCALNSSIPSLNVRQLVVRPDSSYPATTTLGLLIATDVGPAYWDLQRPVGSTYLCLSLPSGGWTLSGFSTPSGCLDTYAVTFANQSPDGRYAAVGTAADGVRFSTNFGKSFARPGTGYKSMPDDVFITVPYARDNNYLFSTSPTYGVFVSRDKGGSFQPFNGPGCTPLNNGAIGFGNGYKRGQAASPYGWNIDAVYAGTHCNGISYRWILGDYVDATGTYTYYKDYLDWYNWGACTLDGGVFTGPVQKIVNLTNGQSAEPIQASSASDPLCGVPGQGMLYNPAGSLGNPAATNFVRNNSGLPNTEATSQKPGQDTAVSATPLSDGAGVSGSVDYGQWKHYYFMVPDGQPHLNVTLNGLSNDADLYVRYAQMPDFDHWHYRPYLGGPPYDEVVDVYPTSSPQPLMRGVWYISVYGYAGGTTSYTLTASLLASWAVETAGGGGQQTTNTKKENGQASALSIFPEPQAPTGTVTWGTISNSGVFKGVGAPGLVASPLVTSWSARNGLAPTNLDLSRATQTVIQLSDGTLLAGQVDRLWRSPAPDEGQTTWENISAQPNISGSSKDVREFLECSNGDVLVAVNGAAGLGGVWLSGSKGSYWMNLSSGFDASSQKLESLVQDNPITGSIQYYTGTDETGAYTRTITAPPYPTVSSLGQTSGSAAGGQTFTINGTGFSNSCPTGTTSDCPFLSIPQVFFGSARVQATWLSATQLSVTTPAHGTGTFAVSVMNPDTRLVLAAPVYTFTGDLNLTLTLSRAPGNVSLNWGTSTQLTVQRCTNAQFVSGVVSYNASGSSWTDISSATTDTSLYFYRIQ